MTLSSPFLTPCGQLKILERLWFFPIKSFAKIPKNIFIVKQLFLKQSKVFALVTTAFYSTWNDIREKELPEFWLQTLAVVYDWVPEVWGH